MKEVYRQNVLAHRRIGVDRLRREGELEDRGRTESIENLVVIGTSAGGYQALRQVIRELSTDIPAAIVIMLHRSPNSDAFKLEEWLGVSTHIPIVKISSGDQLRSGMIFIAPPGMSISLKETVLHVIAEERGTGPLTTINLLFESAAREYRHRVIGVVLTGLLKDGTDGLKAIHEAGGLTIVQDPAEAEYPDMPASAMKDLAVTFCLGLAEIGPTLDLLARRSTKLETGLAVSVRMLKERVTLLARLIDQSRGNPATGRFLFTEMRALEGDLRSLEALVAQTLVKSKSAHPRSFPQGRTKL